MGALHRTAAGEPAAGRPGPASPPAQAEHGGSTPASSWYALGVLLIVSTYSVMDRQIFILLNEPIRAELSLSDTQMGLLQGAGLALFSVITTYPISWLADRYDRRVVTAGCVATWSLAVVLCGLAPSFPWLLVGASVIGVGEAGLGPAALAMLPDLFPASKLQRANSILVIGIRLGASLGVLLAGYLVVLAGSLRAYMPAGMASLSDWRLALFTGALFMPVAVLMLLSMPRRASGLSLQPKLLRTSNSGQPLAPFLRRYAAPVFSVFFGIAFAASGFFCTAVWVPVAAQRYFGQSPEQGGQWLAAIGLTAAIAGFALGTPLVRWVQARFGVRTPLVVLAAALFGSVPLSISIGFATDLRMLYGALALQMAALMVVTMVIPTMLQMMAPQHVRARLFALYTIFNLAAASLSPLVVGLVSDAFSATERSLLTAAMLVSVVSLLIAGAIFWATVRTYGRMVNEVMREEASGVAIGA